MRIPPELYDHDTTNMRSHFNEIHENVRDAYEADYSDLIERLRVKKTTEVYVCGMGGSAIAGDLLGSYLQEELRVTTVRDYEIRRRIKEEDLIIISSYSGNTEEAISCYRKARRASAQVVIVSTGGRLRKGLDENMVPLLKLPHGYPPRAALPFSFFTMLKLFEDLGLIEQRTAEVEDLIGYLVKTDLETHGYSLAEKIGSKIPVIYTSQKYAPISYRWKTQFNENAKTMAIATPYSEANHNEICGFRNAEIPMHVVMLSFDDDHPRIKKRYDITKKLIKKHGYDTTEIRMKGNTLTKMFSAIILGDWTSYFTALMHETNPSGVEEIDALKQKLGKFI